MARFSINYDNILSRIEEVSFIDTETVYFVKVSSSPCTNCTYDPITGTSSDAFCPVCNGTGTIKTQTKTPITASVDRTTGIENYFEPGGRLQRGAVIMTVHANQLEEHDYDLESDWYKVFDWVEIGSRSKKYKLAENDGAIPQTLQGEIYEILFHLSLISTE